MNVVNALQLMLAAEVDAEASFAALVERQSRFVFQVAYSVVRNRHDAEDIVQDTFFKLYRSKSWIGIRDERAFLARAAWRLAVSRGRRATERVDVDMPDPGRGPESAAVDADRQAAVHRMIDALPEELRQPLALSAIEEMDSPAIAEIMGIPEGTVRTRLQRARALLKQKLAALREGRHGR